MQGRHLGFWAALSFGFFVFAQSADAGTVPGSINGDFSVSATGSALYTIPIDVPNGINNLQPKLELDYSSQGGNGLLGKGWSIGGLSTISRCGKTLAQNDAIHGVDGSNADRLCLDGDQLKPDSGNYWADGTVYRTELERFSRITESGRGDTASFTVETKSGLTLYYGDTSATRAQAVGGNVTYAWLLRRVEDRSGNFINYVYNTSQGAYRLTEANYAGSNGYRVVFSYESRPDSVTQYFLGGTLAKDKRLKAVTVKSKSGTVLRTYSLTYDQGPVSGVSRITRLQECGKNNADCYTKSRFSWTSGDTAWTSKTAVNAWQPKTLLVPDLNGDGRKDVVYAKISSDNMYISWFYRLGLPGGGYGSEQSTNLPHQNTELGTKAFVVDRDGDGHDELMMPGAGSAPNWKFAEYTGSGTFSIQDTGYPAINTSEPEVVNVYDVFVPIDVNGDGKTDLIRRTGENVGAGTHSDPTSGDLRFMISNGSGWTDSATNDFDPGFTVYKWAGPNVAVKEDDLATIKIGDLNGDGLTDIVMRGLSDANGEFHYFSLRSQGVNPNANRVFDFQVTQMSVEPHSDSMALIDVNADGYADFLYRLMKQGGAYIQMNDGAGFTAPQPAAIGDRNNATLQSLDLDLNGLPDVFYNIPEIPEHGDDCLHYNSPPQCYPAVPPDPQMWIAYANGQTIASGVSLPDVPSGCGESGCWKITDINGDGLSDLVLPGESLVRDGAKPDLMTGITDGFGNTFDITYSPLTDGAVHSKGSGAISGHPEINHWQGSRWVVENYVANDGSGGNYTVDYRYDDAWMDTEGRGFLGFGKRVVTDSRSGSVTYEFRQDWPYTGMLLKKTLRKSGGTPSDPAGQIISQTLNTLAVRDYGDSKYPYIQTQVKNIYDLTSGQLVKSTRVQQLGPNGEMTPGAALDPFGDAYVTSSAVSDTDLSQPASVGAYTKTTERTYDTLGMSSRVTNWCAAPPDTVKVIHGVTGGTSTTLTTSNTVDPVNCRLTSQQSDAAYQGQDLGITTSYQYDSFGNVTQQTVTANATGESRTTRTGYSADGRFPESVTNAAGETTNLTWESDTGLKQSTTDPNGLPTTWHYDAFGRVEETDSPGGVKTAITRESCSSGCYGGGSYRVTTSTTDATGNPGGQQVAVYDSFQRKVHEAHQTLNGDWSVVDTAYDAQGRVGSTSLPHREGVAAGETVFTYDALDRRIYADGPGAHDVQTSYSGLTTTVTDPLGHKKVTEKDLMGRVVRVTEAQGTAQQSTLNYHYDPMGNLDWVEEPGENGNRVKVQMSYDVSGNKREMTDPDMGHWTYTYDAFGELTQQTDAKGQVTQLTYDAAGRLKTRTTAQGTTTWTYGVPGQEPAVGLLKQVGQSWDGYSKQIGYTNLSQPQVITETIDGIDYRVTKTYDSFGRVKSVEYPDSSAPVTNQAPQIVLDVSPDGSSQILTGTAITLDASQSNDPDNWRDPISFLWQASAPDGSTVDLSGVTSSTTSFTPDIAGVYQIQLSVSDGENVTTKTVSITVSPKAPADFAITPNPSTTGSYTLNWTASSDMTSTGGYQVFDGAGISNPDGSTPLYNGQSPNFAVSGKPNGSWTYGVRACDQGLCGPLSQASVSVTLPPSTPSAFTGSPATSRDGSYDFSWGAPSEAFTGYRLEESDTGTFGDTSVTSLTPPDTSLSLSGQSSGIRSYRLKACNGTACSSATSSVDITVTPSTPSSINAPNQNADGGFTVSWGTASNGVDKYILQESKASDFGSISRSWNTGTGTSKAVTVYADDLYYYRVKACFTDANRNNANLCGPYKTAGSAVNVVFKPGVPGGLSSSENPTSDGTYTISWNASSHAETYQLQKRHRTCLDTSNSVCDPSSWSTVYSGSGRSKSFNDTTAPYYDYRVRATNSDNGHTEHSAWSSVIHVHDYAGGDGVLCPPKCDPGVMREPLQQSPIRFGKSVVTHLEYASYAPRSRFHAMHPARPADRATQVTSNVQGTHRQARAIRTAYSGDTSGYRVIVSYDYDNSGHLLTVTNGRTGKLYWQATQADAWDHQKQVQLGNGLTVNKSFDPDTGRLAGIQSGLGGGSGAQDLAYAWDADGNLQSRTDNRTAHSEVFSYDAQHRLTGSTLDGASNLTLTYDDAGNIASKTTAAGTLTYDYSGSAGLHAVTGVSGLESHSYTYDANGNIDSRDGATVDWTPDNYPDRIAGNGTVSYFSYGPDHQRYREMIEDGTGNVQELRISIGTLFEVIQKSDGSIRYQHHIKAAGVDIALETRQANQTAKTTYLLHDHLGGINAIADDNGNVVARMSFGAYGKRRNADTWAGDLTDTQKQALHDQYNRGYTGHEMLDNLDLIHMNGRVYDQGIGRFISPDPNIQAPGHSENYNRYAYVMNNPLTLNDPSGFMAKLGHPGIGDPGRDKYCEEFAHVCKKEKQEAADKAFHSYVDTVISQMVKETAGDLSKVSSLPQQPQSTENQNTGTAGTQSTGSENSPNSPSHGNPDHPVAVGGANHSVIILGNGYIEIREGGTRAWRNNNPGNMRPGSEDSPSSKHGIGEAGGFEVFPSGEVGGQALDELLHTPGYQSLSVNDAMSRYAPSTENNTRAYQHFVDGKIGVQGSKPMRDLTEDQFRALMDAIRTYEGWEEGNIIRYNGGDSL